MAQVGLQRTLEWPGARVCFLPLVMVSTALVSFSAMAMELDGKRNRQASCESKTKVLGKRRACTTILAKCVKKLVVLKYFLSHNLAHRAHAIVLIRHDHCIEGHEVGNWWQTSLTSGSTHQPTIYNAQCAFWVLRWPCGQNGPVYATGPYYVAHVVDTGP